MRAKKVDNKKGKEYLDQYMCGACGGIYDDKTEAVECCKGSSITWRVVKPYKKGIKNEASS